MAVTFSRYSKTLYPILGAIGFVALIDTSMISPIIASYAKSLGADAALAGLIAGIYSLISIPMIVLSGFVSDVIGRRRSILFGLVGDLMAMILYLFSPSAGVLLATRILHAVFDSFIVPPTLALIGDLFSRSVAGPLSLLWIFMAAALIVGSGSASGLVSAIGFQAVFIVVAALISACIAITVRGLPLSEGGAYRGRAEARLIRLYAPRVAISMTSTFSMYLLIGAIVGTLPTILIDRFGLDERGAAAQIGVFMVISTSVSIPLFPLSARLAERKTPLIPLLAGLIASSAASLMLEFGAGSLLNRLLASIIFGVSLSTILLASSYLVVTLPKEVRGLGSGLNQSASLLGVAIGAPLTALYFITLGMSSLFIIFGATPPLVTAALIPALWKMQTRVSAASSA